jgi:hypothetical protein
VQQNELLNKSVSLVEQWTPSVHRKISAELYPRRLADRADMLVDWCKFYTYPPDTKDSTIKLRIFTYTSRFKSTLYFLPCFLLPLHLVLQFHYVASTIHVHMVLKEPVTLQQLKTLQPDITLLLRNHEV